MAVVAACRLDEGRGLRRQLVGVAGWGRVGPVAGGIVGGDGCTGDDDQGQQYGGDRRVEQRGA